MQSGDANERLRVLMVITRGEPGGAQVHVRDLLAGLRDRVDLQLALGEAGFLSEEARALGVPVHLVPSLRRPIHPVHDVAAARRLTGLIEQLRPHLVHTHSSKAGLLGRLAARRAGRPAIHTAHSWAFSDGIPWRRKAMAIPLEAVAGRWTARFIVVSAADREVGLRYRVADAERIRIVHNGVVDSPLRARPERAGTPTIVMVARLAEPKDPVLLLRALAGVRAPFQLRLVGDGPDRARVEAAVSRLGLADRVELAGTRRDVDAVFADAQVGVLISRQEGFPLVVLEAMRAGLPVVASDVGGVSEAVIPGRTGILVPRGDVDALRGGLERLLTDASLRRRLGRAGRAEYEARFTAARMVEATAAVYAELAAEHGLPPLGAAGADVPRRRDRREGRP